MRYPNEVPAIVERKAALPSGHRRTSAGESKQVDIIDTGALR